MRDRLKHLTNDDEFFQFSSAIDFQKLQQTEQYDDFNLFSNVKSSSFLLQFDEKKKEKKQSRLQIQLQFQL